MTREMFAATVAWLKYLRSGKKKTLKRIADELGIPLPTVKSWKQRDRWAEG